MVTESNGEENTYLFPHCILNFDLILLIFYLNSKVQSHVCFSQLNMDLDPVSKKDPDPIILRSDP